MRRNLPFIASLLVVLMSCNQKVYQQRWDGIFILNDVRSISYCNPDEKELRPSHYDSFDTNGNIVLSKDFFFFQKRITLNSYDEDNRLTQRIIKESFKNRGTRYWEYDNQGRVLSDSSTDSMGNFGWVARTSYHRDGDTLTTIREWGGENSYVDNWKTVKVETGIRRRQVLVTTLHYDERNEHTRTSYMLSTYFPGGRLRQLQEWEESTVDSTVTIFNRRGFCTDQYSRRLSNQDSLWIIDQHYRGDRNGNWLEAWVGEYKKDTFKSHYKYQFDHKGNWTESIMMKENEDTTMIRRRKISYY